MNCKHCGQSIVRDYSARVIGSWTHYRWSEACGKPEPTCTCYPNGLSPETYEGPQHHCHEHGHGNDLRGEECPDCITANRDARNLQAELARLEQTDPAVKAASAGLDAVYEHLKGKLPADQVAAIYDLSKPPAIPQPVERPYEKTLAPDELED